MPSRPAQRKPAHSRKKPDSLSRLPGQTSLRHNVRTSGGSASSPQVCGASALIFFT